MIYSMTAFAREQAQNDFGEIIFEIRSVNQRFLDLHFRLPEAFRYLETELRTRISKQLKRGKIEVSLSFKAGMAGTEIKLNQSNLQQLSKAIDEAQSTVLNLAPMDPLALLKWPGITSSNTTDVSIIEEAMLTTFDNALHSLKENRQREGAALADMLLQRIHGCEAEVTKVEKVSAEIVTKLRQKLRDKIAVFEVEVNAERLEQEIVMQCQKADIAEEIDRLLAHLIEVKNVLAKGGAVGRRLDFLMQELNREANTLGSKATTIDTTNVSVELKVLIEQMREQIQNIE